MAIPDEEKQNARVEIAFAAQEKQNATRKWQFPMRKSKMLAWKSLLLRRKGKIRARQSSGSLRSEASQGSSTASRRATRASLTSFLAALFSITGSWRSPVSKCRASSLYSVPELSLGDGNGRRPGGIGLQQTTPGRFFETGTTIVSLRSSITYDAAKSSTKQEQIERDTTEAYCPSDAS